MSQDKTEITWVDQDLQFNTLSAHEQNEVIRTLKWLDRKDIEPMKKNICAHYYVQAIQQAQTKKEKDEIARNELRNWTRTSLYKKIKEELVQKEIEKFKISGMVIVMMATLVFFFLKAVISGKYLINFSIDAIVGALAIVFLFRNMQVKYRIVKRDSDFQYHRNLDVLSFVLCGLLKIWLSPFIDVSFIVLLVSYFLQRKRFEMALKKIQ